MTPRAHVALVKNTTRTIAETPMRSVKIALRGCSNPPIHTATRIVTFQARVAMENTKHRHPRAPPTVIVKPRHVRAQTVRRTPVPTAQRTTPRAARRATRATRAPTVIPASKHTRAARGLVPDAPLVLQWLHARQMITVPLATPGTASVALHVRRRTVARRDRVPLVQRALRLHHAHQQTTVHPAMPDTS